MSDNQGATSAPTLEEALAEIEGLKEQLSGSDLKVFTQNRELRQENGKLREEVSRLTEECVTQTFAVRGLEKSKAQLEKVGAEQSATIAEHESTIAQRETTIAEQQGMIAQQQAKIAEHEARIAELEGRADELTEQLGVHRSQEIHLSQELERTITTNAEELSRLRNEHDQELQTTKQTLEQARAELEKDLSDKLAAKQREVEGLENRVEQFKEEFLSQEIGAVAAAAATPAPPQEPQTSERRAFPLLRSKMEGLLGFPGKMLVEQVFRHCGADENTSDPAVLEEAFEALQDTASKLVRNPEQEQELSALLKSAWQELGLGSSEGNVAQAAPPEAAPVTPVSEETAPDPVTEEVAPVEQEAAPEPVAEEPVEEPAAEPVVEDAQVQESAAPVDEAAQDAASEEVVASEAAVVEEPAAASEAVLAEAVASEDVVESEASQPSSEAEAAPAQPEPVAEVETVTEEAASEPAAEEATESPAVEEPAAEAVAEEAAPEAVEAEPAAEEPVADEPAAEAVVEEVAEESVVVEEPVAEVVAEDSAPEPVEEEPSTEVAPEVEAPEEAAPDVAAGDAVTEEDIPPAAVEPEAVEPQATEVAEEAPEPAAEEQATPAEEPTVESTPEAETEGGEDGDFDVAAAALQNGDFATAWPVFNRLRQESPSEPTYLVGEIASLAGLERFADAYDLGKGLDVASLEDSADVYRESFESVLIAMAEHAESMLARKGYLIELISLVEDHDRVLPFLEEAEEIGLRTPREGELSLLQARYRVGQDDVTEFLIDAMCSVSDKHEVFDLLHLNLERYPELSSLRDFMDRLMDSSRDEALEAENAAKELISGGEGVDDLLDEVDPGEEALVQVFLEHLLPRTGVKVDLPSEAFEELLQEAEPAAFVGALRQALRSVDYTVFFDEIEVLSYDGDEHFLLRSSPEPKPTLLFGSDVDDVPPEELRFLVLRELFSMYRRHSHLNHLAAQLDDKLRYTFVKTCLEIHKEAEFQIPEALLSQVGELEGLAEEGAQSPEFRAKLESVLTAIYQATESDSFLELADFLFDGQLHKKWLDPLADAFAAKQTGLVVASFAIARDSLESEDFEALEEAGFNWLYSEENLGKHRELRARLQRLWVMPFKALVSDAEGEE